MLSCAVLDVGPVTSNAQEPPADDLQSQVEAILEASGLPGLAVAILEPGTPLQVATAGFADLERNIPIRADTPFLVGSISKNIFATIALVLVEEKRVSLDDPLSRFTDWPRGDDITIRMLLNHTSGIPDYLGSVAFSGVISATEGFFSTPRSTSAIYGMLPRREPTFDPGTSQAYSNTNGLLIGTIIEKVTGRALGEVLDERIVDPLELSHTYLYGQRTTDRPRARGYCKTARWGGTPTEPIDCSYADDALPDSADGSVVSTASDLLRYHQALRGGELLSSDMWAAMRRREPGLDNGLGYLLMDGPLGVHEGNVGRAMGHVAANIYYADLDLFVVMMANQGDGPMPLGQLMDRRYTRP